jgi:predicted Zn-dependent peptidase
MVDIQATEESLIFDFQSVTTPGPGGMVTGLEAVMQVAHVIMTDFLYENDAFERARQGIHEQCDSVTKGLETFCQESLLRSLTGDDARYGSPSHAHIDALSLETCEAAVRRQLNPATCEVSMAGDCMPEVFRDLALKYLGTVPAASADPSSADPSSAGPVAVAVDPHATSLGALDVGPHVRGLRDPLHVYLSDSDARAVGYIGGLCPNLFGIFADGTTVGQRVAATGGSGDAGSKDDLRRRHPLFGHVLLGVLSEVANRRLFSVVREERRLTYDASFQLRGASSVNGGWYLVSVTSSPSQVHEAVEACRDAMHSLKGTFGVKSDGVNAAKRTLLNRFRNDMASNKFWVESLCGSQLNCMPNKNLGSIVDYEHVLQGVTVKDVQLLVEVLDLTEDNMTACIGISGPTPPQSC